MLDEYGIFVSYESLNMTYELNGTLLDYEELKHNILKEWLLTTSKGGIILISMAPVLKYI